MKSMIVSILAVMVLAGTAFAAIPSTTEYLLATQPLISGRVATVNDHAMTVDTDQGGHVTLAMDSKTMVPTDLGPGMAMRVEFKAMPDGHLYARRITPIRGGMNTDRELAYARTGGRPMAQYANASTGGGHWDSLPQTASNQPLIMLLGLLAVGTAGALALTRRFRRA
jgi:LPXTG-motif cell wall-anchored protein